MAEFPSSWRPLLETILKHPDGIGLQDIAAATGLSPSAAHQHLRAMAQAQVIERVGERPAVTYRPRPVCQGLWVTPTGRDRKRQPRGWKVIEWTAIGPFAQQFPLVNRIRDADGRMAAERFLKAALDRGLLTPWLLPPPEHAIKSRKLTPGEADAFRANFQTPSRHEGITFIAYGSCVRGDARSGSDLDLLAVTPRIEPIHEDADRGQLQAAMPDLDWNNRLQDLASEINLGSPRSIDLRTVPRDEFFDALPANLRAAILREGVTIHSSFAGGEWVESWEDADG